MGTRRRASACVSVCARRADRAAYMFPRIRTAPRDLSCHQADGVRRREYHQRMRMCFEISACGKGRRRVVSRQRSGGSKNATARYS